MNIELNKDELTEKTIQSTFSDLNFQISQLFKFEIDAKFNPKFNFDVEYHKDKIETLITRLEFRTSEKINYSNSTELQTEIKKLQS